MRTALLTVYVLLLVLRTAPAQVYRGYNEDGNGQSKEQAERKRREVKGHYEGGALHYAVTYKRGKLDGDAREYYEDGTLKAEVKFQNGRRDGVARYYYPNGMLKARILYNRDREAGGKSKFYDESGVLSREEGVSGKVSSVLDTLAGSTLPAGSTNTTPAKPAPDTAAKQ